MSAHWLGAQRHVLEGGGGIHTAGLVAPMFCGEVEDEDEGEGEGEEDDEVSAAPFAGLVTLAVGGQASHLLAWPHY